MKTILVPSDFSKPSREAFRLALSIAKNTDLEVVVLNTIYASNMYDSTFVNGLSLTSEMTKLTEDARQAFKKMDWELNTASVKTSFEVLYIDLTAAINLTIEARQIDLVIMGTSGASGLKEVFIGSNTEKVVRTSAVPVLAIHNTTKPHDIKKILLPSTLPLDQPLFIDKIKNLQTYFNASLEILLINTPSQFTDDDQAKQRLEEFASHYKLENYSLHFCNYRNVEDGIIDFAHKENIDLIAMATNARKGLAHLFNGSITEDVVNHIERPVWTFPLQK